MGGEGFHLEAMGRKGTKFFKEEKVDESYHVVTCNFTLGEMNVDYFSEDTLDYTN